MNIPLVRTPVFLSANHSMLHLIAISDVEASLNSTLSWLQGTSFAVRVKGRCCGKLHGAQHWPSAQAGGFV